MDLRGSRIRLVKNLDRILHVLRDQGMLLVTACNSRAVRL
jgi:hypothetical protein